MTTHPIRRWPGVLALGLLMACGDDGEGGTEQTTSSSSTDASTTAPGTTLPSTTDPDGSSSGSPTSSETGSSDSGSGSSSGSSSSGSGSGSSSDSGSSSGSSSGSDSGSSSGDPTGGGPTYCAHACVVPADCAAGGNPADWACTAGFCEYIAVIPPCDPTTCDDVGIGLFCSEFDGISVCLIGCMSDVDCAFFGDFLCSGVDDFGQSFCESAPCGGKAIGDPCFFGGPDQYGVCDGDICTCTDDSQCTAPGYACND